MTLHIFNPSHDEALGFGSPYYVPTKAAQRLASERCVLPKLWAKAGDVVMITDDLERPESSNGVRFIYKRELTPSLIQQISKIEPWGWNAYLRHSLRRCGVSDTLLPTDEELENRRRLSSRETAVLLLKQLINLNSSYAGQSEWCTSIEAAWDVVKNYGTAMVKSPWSSSGRGVFRVEAEDNVIPAHQRMANILRQFGGIAVERYYERLQDFALEFYATQEGHISFAGISVFNTSVGGNYLGNVDGTQDELRALLGTYVAIEEIDQSCQHLQACLANVLNGKYVGPLGVDMMIVRDEGVIRLHPCVEINLRNTMGHVQLLLSQQTKGSC